MTSNGIYFDKGMTLFDHLPKKRIQWGNSSVSSYVLRTAFNKDFYFHGCDERRKMFYVDGTYDNWVLSGVGFNDVSDDNNTFFPAFEV